MSLNSVSPIKKTIHEIEIAIDEIKKSNGRVYAYISNNQIATTTDSKLASSLRQIKEFLTKDLEQATTTQLHSLLKGFSQLTSLYQTKQERKKPTLIHSDSTGGKIYHKIAHKVHQLSPYKKSILTQFKKEIEHHKVIQPVIALRPDLKEHIENLKGLNSQDLESLLMMIKDQYSHPSESTAYQNLEEFIQRLLYKPAAKQKALSQPRKQIHFNFSVEVKGHQAPVFVPLNVNDRSVGGGGKTMKIGVRSEKQDDLSVKSYLKNVNENPYAPPAPPLSLPLKRILKAFVEEMQVHKISQKKIHLLQDVLISIWERRPKNSKDPKFFIESFRNELDKQRMDSEEEWLEVNNPKIVKGEKADPYMKLVDSKTSEIALKTLEAILNP